MFGPLPRFHRFVIAGIVLAVCVSIGLWMGASPQVPVLVSAGLTGGLLVGAGLAWLTAHESHHERAATLRVRRRH
ncbi:hypothetical protein [Nocardioides daphniae]|uniref:Uncharacterized protein n=1 Tax=Nocardioides daphniae TaxID=402297 RepID=A0A4P7UA64_9ACTN|nr:hypothetical protein [Nocardioides daphniae]QCC76950.1 hypothetical protein E2C04_06465 [Nocardioides daphniae]GGD18027.1 hypothetical protein GCM10007231_16370 [Nocardioides daphniae]